MALSITKNVPIRWISVNFYEFVGLENLFFTNSFLIRFYWLTFAQRNATLLFKKRKDMKKTILLSATLAAALLFHAANAVAQHTEKMLRYGDMNQWVVRNIHESAVIGGNTKTLYEVALIGQSTATRSTPTSEVRLGARRTSWRRSWEW